MKAKPEVVRLTVVVPLAVRFLEERPGSLRALLCQVVTENSGFYWEIINRAEQNWTKIKFVQQVLAKETKQPVFKADGSPLMMKVPPKIIANDLIGLFGDKNPYQHSSSVNQGAFVDAAENLAAYRAQQSNYKQGQLAGEPGFPKAPPLAGIADWQPLTFSAGGKVRLLQNNNGTLFVGLPLLARKHPRFKELGPAVNLVPCDGQPAPRGGLVFIPLYFPEKSACRRLLAFCELMARGRAELKLVQVKVRAFDHGDKRRRSKRRRRGSNRRSRFVERQLAGDLEYRLMLHLVFNLPVRRPRYKPQCFAGVAIGRHAIQVALVRPDGNLLLERTWDLAELWQIISEGEETLRRKAKEGQSAKGYTYAPHLQQATIRIVKEVLGFLRGQNAVGCWESLRSLKRRGYSRPMNFELNHYRYRKFLFALDYKAKQLGVKAQLPVKPWGYYRFRCSNCGATNEGIKDRAKMRTGIDEGLFLCSVCRFKIDADVNTARNLGVLLARQFKE